MSRENVVTLTRPGQRCGLCLHFRREKQPTWGDGVCTSITAKNGNPCDIPVVEGAGIKCRYFRQRKGP